jgi:hypothetical protein
MRCEQIIGLKREAVKHLCEHTNRVPHEFCPHCKEVVRYKKDTIFYDKYELSFGGSYDLIEYRLVSGETMREVVQEVKWSSGPCVFLCLEQDGRRMFEWTEEEIKQEL